MNRLQLLLRLVRPFHLLLAALAYSLGLGVAHYLGAAFDGRSLVFGALFSVLLVASGNLLTESFRALPDPFIEGETAREHDALQRLTLSSGASFLAAGAAFLFILAWSHALSLLALLCAGAMIVLALANAIPPVRLAGRGFGELSTALILAYLTPGFAFLLQRADLHRLLTIVTFPLTLLAFGYFLLGDFPTFSSDVRYGRQTLLVRMSWQRAVPLHNVLLVAAYLLYAGTPLLAVPWALIWPALLTAPLAAYQIFMLRNIAEGAKPLWNILSINAAAIFGLTAYLLTLTFWLH